MPIADGTALDRERAHPAQLGTSRPYCMCLCDTLRTLSDDIQRAPGTHAQSSEQPRSTSTGYIVLTTTTCLVLCCNAVYCVCNAAPGPGVPTGYIVFATEGETAGRIMKLGVSAAHRRRCCPPQRSAPA